MLGLIATRSREDTPSTASQAASIHRTNRIYSAWATSFTSKIATLLVQLVSIPAAYRSLGPEAFAAYAAVTSVTAILGFFNFGMGGAMVSPLAHAFAGQDPVQEQEVVGAAVVPLAALSLLIAVIALPLLAVLPLPSLFGQAAKTVSAPMLRAAALLACACTLAALPLSVCGNARQAYQELHVTNAIGTICNSVMFVGMLLVAWLSPTLISFVAVRSLVPVVGQMADSWLLLCRRPYLIHVLQSFSLARAKGIAGDGVFFVAATSTNMLLYQWPIFLMTRMRQPLESSRFAICIQIILLALSFLIGLMQPLWGATAEASVSGDHAWLKAAIIRVQIATVAYGVAAALGFGLLLNFAVSVWLRKPVSFHPAERWLAGAYVLLGGWEYGQWILALGLGRMKPASLAMLARAVLFCSIAPLAMGFGTQGLLCALCASVVFCTSWYYPRLISGALGREW
jgi:O-antigen/teichoic acid export membrane protein